MRHRLRLIGVASVVALGVAVLPGSPAAAEEYDGTCGFGVSDGVWEITSDDGQAQPGGEFTLSNLRMQKDAPAEGTQASVELVVSVGDLDGQVIDMGDSFTIGEPGPDQFNRVWDDVPPFTLEAPEELGPHDITAELVFYDFPNLDTTCELEGDPFADVVVSDDPPPTTTVPNGNGDNGENGNGDNGNGENGNGTPGVSPGEEEAVDEVVDEVVEELAEEVGAAERALTVGAAPRFTG